MKYYAVYTMYHNNTFNKAYIGFAPSNDGNSFSIELYGNPYEAFDNLPEYIVK